MVAGTISTMPGAVASAWTNRTWTATSTQRKSAALLVLARQQRKMYLDIQEEDEEVGMLLCRRTAHIRMINRLHYHLNRIFAVISQEVLLAITM